jgi:hypothetical protein
MRNRTNFLLAAAIVAFAAPPPAAPAADAAGEECGWSTLEQVAFAPTVVAEVKGVASVEVSPDGGWLYASTLGGALLRWPIDPADGALSAPQTFAPAHFQHPDGPRGVIGLAFDPVDPSVLWVTDNYPVALWGAREQRPEFSGRVSRVRIAEGDAFEGTVETYVSGLPRSCGDHLSNSLRFRANPDAAAGGPTHLLYLSQGSNSASGKADRSWCYRPERLLSAAILEIDPSRTPPEGGFDVRSEPIPEGDGNRRFGYSIRVGSFLWALDDAALKSEAIDVDGGPHDGGYLRFAANGVAVVRSGPEPESETVAAFYDPFAVDAPVRLFATGVRNAYDLLWHSNGWLYTAVNGPQGGGAAPDDPRTPIDEEVAKAGRVEDFLLRLGPGDYGGHPNPLRNEFVLHGGNPTEGPDPNEVSFYPVGVAPDVRYRPERARALGHHWSPNGMIEYRWRAGGGVLDGAVIVTNYSKGDNLRAFLLDPDGAVQQESWLVDPDGAELAFVDPLDLALASDGRVYVSTLDRSNGSSAIVRLDPAHRAPSCPAE